MLTAVVQHHDAAARRSARRGRAPRGRARAGQGLPRKHPRQPVGRRARVRREAAAALGQSQRRQRSWASISRRSRAASSSAGTRLDPALAELARRSRAAFAAGGSRANGSSRSSAPHRGGTQLLLLRGTRLPPGAHGGYVVVFDDITHLAAGAARRRVGRSGAAARARDQESADADPAFRRAAGSQARRPSSPAPTPRCWRARRRPSSTRWRR